MPVLLFDAPALVARLRERGVRIGIATSGRAAGWDAARVYRPSANAPVPLSRRSMSLPCSLPLGVHRKAPWATLYGYYVSRRGW